ncbi:MAG TPA: ADP-forming succinate--CoA ligase subunit beta [Thermoplasmata archaeon]|nr:ADP-forming succinate--CoA ligase subunit beta [Thermoplasmata archaeon]
MVKLAEWRGKEIFRKYGISTPAGGIARSPEDAESLVRSGKVPLPCVVKAQVLSGGRGKGGAVRFAQTAEEAASAAKAILALEFKGERVREVLLEAKVQIGREFYLSIALDRSRRLPIVMASAQGGVEIESVAEDQLLRIPVDPFVGLVGYERRAVVRSFGLTGAAAKSLDALLGRAWEAFEKEDAELLEINPLGLVGDGVVALDAKVVIEDDAAFRHPEYTEVRDDRTPLEEIAREKGIAFVQLDGDIGVIANGAGLTMATLDVLAEFGGRPGVFLDLGGTDDPAKVTEAFLLMSKARPSAVFLNIFGGVTRCDTVAKGLVAAMQQVPPSEQFPLVARIRGNNEAEGVAILRAAGVTSLSDLKQSVEAAVAASKSSATGRAGGIA